MKPLLVPLIGALQLYRWVVSPLKTALFGPLARCRYTPCCSAYALEAIRLHGGRGIPLAAKRLLRCHPWGGCGPDPVPRRGAHSSAQGRAPSSPDDPQARASTQPL